MTTDAINRDAVLRMFRKGHRDWPTYLSDSGPSAEKAFFALTDELRQQGVERQADYVAAVREAKGSICSYAVYLKETRWLKLEPRKAVQEGPRMAAPWGKLWMATRLADLLRRPYGAIPDLNRFERGMVERVNAAISGDSSVLPLSKTEQRIFDSGESPAAYLWREKTQNHGWPLANTLTERARERKGYLCSADLLPIASGFQQVEAGSHLFEAWAFEHQRRGWPFVAIRDLPDWVYFPAVPYDANDLEAAARRALDKFDEAARKVRGDEHAA